MKGRGFKNWEKLASKEEIKRGKGKQRGEIKRRKEENKRENEDKRR